MKKFITLTALLILLTGCTEGTATSDGSSPEAKFASCLTEKGAVLYVSATCPHCKTQKEMFKDGLENLKYYDCTVDGNACSAADISAVPTWIFEDGTRLMGTQQFNTLGEQTGCDAPREQKL